MARLATNDRYNRTMALNRDACRWYNNPRALSMQREEEIIRDSVVGGAVTLGALPMQREGDCQK